MNLLRESINKSTKWNFEREYFSNNKLTYTIKNGIIKWYFIEPNIYWCSEIIYNGKNE